jgi:phosphatidylserine/phosphatidylglycerophosphate/cardiolipin synthase-like enzyme
MMKRNRQSKTSRSVLSTLLAAVVVIIGVMVSLFSGCAPDSSTTTPPTSATSRPVSATPRPVTNTPGITVTPSAPAGAVTIPIPQGFGAERGFWQVYFTAPTGSSSASRYVGGIDVALSQAIGAARGTLDIAAFEFNNAVLTTAVLDAHARGVTVRMVADDEHGIEDEDTSYSQFIDAGIPVVDDSRTALMHDKFMIIDNTVVWTGSWNYTVNDTYRNNNNAIALRSRRAVQSYQAEFNEMFERKEFGPRSSIGNGANFNQDGTPIRILFAPEDDVVGAITQTLSAADTSIRFMTFSFTVDAIADVIESRAAQGVNVQGIFETTGSETAFSELTPLFCAGLTVRQDGNGYILHHKVFIVDDDTVITGSFNISDSATRSNDENLIVIQDPVLAAQYIAEFDRRWAEAKTPTRLTCS